MNKRLNDELLSVALSEMAVACEENLKDAQSVITTASIKAVEQDPQMAPQILKALKSINLLISTALEYNDVFERHRMTE